MPYAEYYDQDHPAPSERRHRGSSTYSSRSSRVRFAIGAEAATEDSNAASGWRSEHDASNHRLSRGQSVESGSSRQTYIDMGGPAPKSSSGQTTHNDLEQGANIHGVKPVSDSDMEDGYLSHLVEHDEDNNWDNLDEQQPLQDEEQEEGNELYEQIIDQDDPLITHKRKQQLDDFDGLDYPQYRSYKERRKSARAVKIQYNVSSIVNREKFLIKLGRALMTFGAPSHRIEAQLLSAARILELKAEFIHVPGLIMCSFVNEDEKSSETHFIRCQGRMALGRLHEVHQIYRGVVHDELSAKRAGQKLDALLEARPIYGSVTQLILSFWIATLICPLAFGGSLVDMWLAGLFAVFLAIMRNGVIAKAKSWYAHVFEVCVVMLISFAARALGSIQGGLFCYNAIASASIVSILPGFLILSGSLELASKNIACGSIKMMYALIYTFFLGFGLQIGNDLYLVIDHRARDRLDQLATRVYTQLSVVGEFVPDNGTFAFINHGQPLNGTFTFMDLVDPTRDDRIIVGCLREPGLPWYLQPFPWWSQFIIVPIFSLLSSLMNLQPIWSWDMLVMIVISCISYTTNKVANHFIPNRSDFVSFIGAFSVGILGNLYSRRMNGTAFTVMVTGVLFLVPSGLSAVGGITAQGSGIDIGGAMIAVVIGVTCGLFVSQAVVYAFGTRKNAAIFSF